MRQPKKVEFTRAPNGTPARYPLTGQFMVRPHINFVAVALNVFLTLAIILAICLWAIPMLNTLEWYREIFTLDVAWQYVLLYLLLLLITLIVRIKSIAIFAIRLYQRYARYGIRCNCVFIPNCSEYMILSIRKHGIIFGLKKGFRRLLKCHDPYEGDDYP